MAENTTGTPSFARRGALVKFRYSALHACHILLHGLHSVALLRLNDSLLSAASFPIFPFGWSWKLPQLACWLIFRKKTDEPFWYTSSSPVHIVHDMMYFQHICFLAYWHGPRCIGISIDIKHVAMSTLTEDDYAIDRYFWKIQPTNQWDHCWLIYLQITRTFACISLNVFIYRQLHVYLFIYI